MPHLLMGHKGSGWLISPLFMSALARHPPLLQSVHRRPEGTFKKESCFVIIAGHIVMLLLSKRREPKNSLLPENLETVMMKYILSPTG